jgi:hypothetical protein
MLASGPFFGWCTGEQSPWLGLFESDRLDAVDVVHLRDEVFPQELGTRIEKLWDRAALQSPCERRELVQGRDGERKRYVQHGPVRMCRRASKTAGGLLELCEPRKKILIFGPTKAL